jgi:hypothetical protein
MRDADLSIACETFETAGDALRLENLSLSWRDVFQIDL